MTQLPLEIIRPILVTLSRLHQTRVYAQVRPETILFGPADSGPTPCPEWLTSFRLLDQILVFPAPDPSQSTPLPSPS